MKLVVINALATSLGPFQGLPSGGVVKAGVNQQTVFDLDDEDQLEQALNGGLGDAIDDGDVSVFVRGDSNDLGQRLYCERITLGHAGLTDADTSQVISSGYELPEGAIQAGYRKNVSVAFAGGDVSAVTVDVGFAGAGAGDLLDDGQSIAAAAETFGAGANATPLVRRDIGGKTFQVKVDSVDGDVADLTAGAAVFELFYFVR